MDVSTYRFFYKLKWSLFICSNILSLFNIGKEVGNIATFGIGHVGHQCHVLGYVSFMFEDPDDNKQHIVSLGFSTDKNRPNTAGVQIGSISKKDEKELAFMHSHSQSYKTDWETFSKQSEKIAVECKFDNKSYSIVHFKFSNL